VSTFCGENNVFINCSNQACSRGSAENAFFGVFRAHGACHGGRKCRSPRWAELTALPKSLSCILWAATSRRGKKRGRGMMGRKTQRKERQGRKHPHSLRGYRIISKVEELFTVQLSGPPVRSRGPRSFLSPCFNSGLPNYQ